MCDNEIYKPDHPNCNEALLSIVRSIANEENALACLISAECSKINQIVGNYNDIDTLIRIDEAVLAVLQQITEMEDALKDKLDAVLPFLECRRSI